MDAWTIVWLMVVWVWVWYWAIILTSLFNFIKSSFDKKERDLTDEERAEWFRKIREDLKRRKKENSIIISHNWFKFIWPKRLDWWFYPMNDRYYFRSLTDKMPLEDWMKEVEVVKVDDEFYKWFLRLVFTVRKPCFTWL